MSNSLKILLVLEQQSDIKLIESILKDSDVDFDARYAKTENEFLKHINRFQPEIIISGHNFIKFSLEEQLDYLNEQNLMIPLILLVGTMAEDLLQDYLKKGVDDYVTRYNLLQLPNMIMKAIEAKQLKKNKELVEETLRQKERRLNRLFENIPDSIFELGFNCEISQMNPVAEELLNFRSKLKLRKLKFTDIVSKGDLKAFRDFHAMICRGQKKEMQFRIINGRDEMIWLDCKGIPMYDDEQNITSILLIVRDITEQKNAAELLLKTKIGYESILEAITEAIWSIDKDFKVSSYNRSAEKLYQTYFKTRVRSGISINQLHALPSQLEEWKKRYETVFNGTPAQFDDCIVLNNEKHYYSTRLYPIVLNDSVTGVSVVCKDITKSKMAEDQLFRTNELFRILTVNAPVVIYQNDRTGQCTYVNERWTQLTGLSAKDTLGYGWVNAIHPEDRQKVHDYWELTVVQGVEFNMEYRLLVNNKVIWVNGNAVAQRNEKDEIIGFIGTLSDITPLKLSTQTLLEKQSLLDEIGKNPMLSFSSAEVVPPYRIYGNENTYRLIELPSTLPLTIEQVFQKIHPLDIERVKNVWHQMIEGAKPVKVEYRLQLPGGRTKHVLTSISSLKDNDGKVIKLFAATIDQTREKEELKRLEEAQKMMKDSYLMAQMGKWELDLESDMITFSEEVKEMMRLRSGESTGMKGLIDMIHPEDRQAFESFKSKQQLSGRSDMLRVRMIIKGKTGNYVISSHGIPDEYGNITKLSGLIMDVSESIQKEKKVETFETMFREIFDLSPDAMFIEDEHGFILDANSKACQFQRLPKSELVGMNILDITPAKHREKVSDDFRRMVSGELTEFQSSTWSADGSEIPVEIRVSPISYDNTKAFLLVVRDISKWMTTNKPVTITGTTITRK